MNKLLKGMIVLFISTILSKLLGFAREAILVSTYGAGMVSDVYITTMNIPSTLFEIIATALSTTFIPLFFKIQEKEGDKKTLKFANNIFNIVIILSLTLSILGYIFAQPLVKLFAINFTGEKLRLATDFTKILVFSMIFIGLSTILSSWLQIKGNFHIPGMVSVPGNIIIIASILMSYKYDIKILIIGSLTATLSKVLFQLPFAYKSGYKYKPYINLKDENIREMIFLLVPVFIGVGVSQLNSIIDRSLASTLGDGMITILNSASRLEIVISTLFISTMTSVIYPKISELYSKGLKKEFNTTIQRSINIMTLLILPISIGAIILSEPIVSLVFERGKFDSVATNLTAAALSFYCIGMVGSSITTMLNRVFYAINDTKTPMIISAISISINILLNLILIRPMGYKGLALSTSISSISCALLLFRSLDKKNIGFRSKDLITTSLKVLLSSIIMGFVTYFIYNMFTNILLGLIISVLVSIVVYFIIISIMKIKEVELIRDKIKDIYYIKGKKYIRIIKGRYVK